jgi:hypothetical protein
VGSELERIQEDTRSLVFAVETAIPNRIPHWSTLNAFS